MFQISSLQADDRVYVGSKLEYRQWARILAKANVLIFMHDGMLF